MFLVFDNKNKRNKILLIKTENKRCLHLYNVIWWGKKKRKTSLLRLHKVASVAFSHFECHISFVMKEYLGRNTFSRQKLRPWQMIHFDITAEESSQQFNTSLAEVGRIIWHEFCGMRKSWFVGKWHLRFIISKKVFEALRKSAVFSNSWVNSGFDANT